MITRRVHDTVLDYLPSFSTYMLTSTRLSVRTQQVYTYEVKRFGEAVNNPPVGELTPGLLLTWHAAFYKAGAAPATVRQKHAAVKRFLRYLIRFEKVESAQDMLNAFEDLQVPNRATPARESFALTREQVDKMLVAAERHAGVGLRNRTILHFMWATGVRRSELADLEMELLDLEQRVASVVGKGSKERTVVFDAATGAQLQKWLVDRKTWPVHCDKVFISAGGHRLDPGAISNLVSETAKAAGLRKPVWAHLLRHTAITDLLAGGMQVQDAAKIAGHSSPDTTMIYTHQTPANLRTAYDRARADRRRAPAVPEPDEEES